MKRLAATVVLALMVSTAQAIPIKVNVYDSAFTTIDMNFWKNSPVVLNVWSYSYYRYDRYPFTNYQFSGVWSHSFARHYQRHPRHVSVPEPETLGLMLVGLLGLAFRRKAT